MIFYLSCTGNTRWAAAEIARRTGDTLVDITKTGQTTFAPEPGERIGFCFPVHGWRPPKLLRRFVANLDVRSAGGHYCYALCTAGDDIGEAVKILAGDLAAKGLRLDSAFSLIMPESYVGLTFMDVDSPENEARKKRRAAACLQEYISMIEENKVGEMHLDTGRWPRINSRVLGAFFTRYLITDNPFRVTVDKCVGCGACARACPVGNIVMDGGLPRWTHGGDCLACFACYHHCPHHAIEYGRRTKNKGQYFYK